MLFQPLSVSDVFSSFINMQMQLLCFAASSQHSEQMFAIIGGCQRGQIQVALLGTIISGTLRSGGSCEFSAVGTDQGRARDSSGVTPCQMLICVIIRAQG